MRVADRVVLVTGASSGIGRALAVEFARRGAVVVLHGRHEGRLREARAEASAAGGRRARAVALDLGGPGAPERLVAETVRLAGVPAVVACNAGVNLFGRLEDAEPAELETVLRTNLLAPALLAGAAARRMLPAGGGRIVFVGSVLGHVGFPCHAAYSASKGGLRLLAESLRREWAGTGLGVTWVAPRGVRTPMTDALAEATRAAGSTLDEPDAVARRIADAVESGAREVVIGGPESFFALANSLVPGLVDRAIRGKAALLRRLAARSQAAVPPAAAAPARAVTARAVP